METQRNSAIGAGAGTAIGTGLGLAAGTKKAGQFLASKGITKGMNVDQYIDKRQTANLENLIGSNASQRTILKVMKETATKAASDFESLVKKASSTKNKYAAAVGVIGLAVGTVASYLISKNSKKAD